MPHIIIISILAIMAYQIFYLALPGVPGNNLTYPAGWIGWADQGNYYRSATAFSQLNFEPDEHLYPFLYALLGSLFIKWFPTHPFYFVNLACLIIFMICCYLIISSYLHRAVALGITIAGNFLHPFFFTQWVIPWTSTLSSALIAVNITLCHLLTRDRSLAADTIGHRILWSFIFGATAGAVVCVRPVDSVIVLICCIYFSAIYILHAIKTEPSRRKLFLGAVAVAAFSAILFASAFFGFNRIVYGTIISPYITYNSTVNGFWFSDIPEKIISLIFDPTSIYLAQGKSLMTYSPAIVFSIFLLPLAIIVGDRFIRLISILIATWYLLYFAYADLLPYSLFMFGAVHYFKWTYPLLLMLSVLCLFRLYQMAHSYRQYAFILGAVFLLFGFTAHFIHIETSPVEQKKVSVENNRISIEYENRKELHYIDIFGLPAENRDLPWSDIYHDSQTQVTVDGDDEHKLTFARYIRLIPGNGFVRIVFIRPVTAKNIEIHFSEGFKFTPPDIKEVASGDARISL